MTNGNSINTDKIKHTEVDEQLLKNLKTVNASKTDIDSHEGKLSEIENKYKIDAIWRKF